MRVIYSGGGAGGSGLWVLPLLAGLTLIAVAILIILYPPILAYAVAFLMMSAGVSMIGMAFTWRSAFRGSDNAATGNRQGEWEVVESPRDGLP